MNRGSEDLTQERLKEIVDYDPMTGLFFRKIKNKRSPAGAACGVDNGRGYLRLRIDGRNYMLHRLAFLYMTGEFPKNEVDHINHIRKDNSWENLRQCSRTENLRNMAINNKNTTGFPGVTWRKRDKKFYAQVNCESKRIHIGSFDDAESAFSAYTNKCRELGFHENHGKSSCGK